MDRSVKVKIVKTKLRKNALITKDASNVKRNRAVTKRPTERSLKVEDVKMKLRNNIFVMKDVSNDRKYKSSVWKKFLRIHRDSEALDFVACKVCGSVYQYSATYGTNAMRKHKCRKEGKADIACYFDSTQSQTESEKEKFLLACVKFIACDIRPYNVVSGLGFRELIQTAIDIGVNIGRVQAESIVPHRKTISTRAKQIAADLRIELKNEMITEITNGYCAVTMDLWTDDYRKRSYLTVKVHYIDRQWNLNERVLETVHFEREKDDSNIYMEVQGILERNEIMSSNVVFVTDRESDILESHTQINCAAHLMNNVLESTFSNLSYSSEGQCINILLQQCRELVSYFKQSGLMDQLDEALKEHVSTTWNSNLTMLTSVQKNLTKIKEILTGTDEFYRVQNIDPAILKMVIDFLSPFQEFKDLVEMSGKPTIHTVIPAVCTLLQRLEENPKDAQLFGELKTTTSRLLQENFQEQIFHKVALYLNPKMRSLKALHARSRADTLEEVRCRLQSIDIITLSNLSTLLFASSCSNAGEHRYADKQLSSGRKKIGLLSAWEDEEDEVESSTGELTAEAEMQMYQSIPVPSNHDFQLLEWWKNHSTDFPRLSNLAKQVFCIPATSKKSEQNFSASGLVLDKLRTRLSPKNVDDLLLLRSNWDIVLRGTQLEC